MPALVTESNRTLLIPEDNSCAILYTPPGKDEGMGYFSNALRAEGLNAEKAIVVPEDKAKPLLRDMVSSLVKAGWADEAEAPAPTATTDDMIKWIDATIDIR